MSICQFVQELYSPSSRLIPTSSIAEDLKKLVKRIEDMERREIVDFVSMTDGENSSSWREAGTGRWLLGSVKIQPMAEQRQTNTVPSRDTGGEEGHIQGTFAGPAGLMAEKKGHTTSCGSNCYGQRLKHRPPVHSYILSTTALFTSTISNSFDLGKTIKRRDYGSNSYLAISVVKHSSI